MKAAWKIACGRKLICRKVTPVAERRSALCAARYNPRPARPNAAATAMTVSHRRDALRVTATDGPVVTAEPETACKLKAMSRADWKRSPGFFSRQCCTMRCSAGDEPETVSYTHLTLQTK